MTKQKSTKKTLLTSALSLVLCIALLIGTTFAWFTDNVTSANNKIVAGNLDVQLLMNTGDGYKDISESASPIFGAGSVAQNNNAETLWEPGKTQIAYLAIKNNGNLALKYTVALDVENVSKDLYKVMEYAIVPDAQYDAKPAWAGGNAVTEGLQSVSGNVSLGVGATHYFALAIHMQETAGNEYMNGEVNFDLTVLATQDTVEADSFGTDYDAKAQYDTVLVSNAADLLKAVAGGSRAVLTGDIAVDTAAVVPEGVAAVIDLNGNNLTANVVDAATGKLGNAVENHGTLTLTGEGTIKTRNVMNYPEGNLVIEEGVTIVAASPSSGSAIWNEGKATVKGATLLQENITNYAINNVAATSNLVVEDAVVVAKHGAIAVTAGSVTIKDGEFTVTNGFGTNGEARTDHCIYVAGGTLKVEGGTFMGTEEGGAGDSVICATGGATNITGGTFVTLGCSKYCAEVGLTETGTTWVTGESVKDETELKDVLKNAGAAGAGDTMVVLSEDLDMSGIDWTPIKVDGYHGADIVTIEGNGNTIKGLDAPLFAGGFAGGSGIVIKNLTIADSDIVSTNTIGSGAFIESVDSMATITLDNCHLVNSTVKGGDGSRTGGLIGWTAGYNNVNDGPVKTYVTIKNCSVIGCEITCDGSVGAIYGHAGNNAWTYSTVENCVVKDNILTSTDDGGWRVGVVVGTANEGELTISNITSSGNVLSQTGKTAPEGQSDLYGRAVLNKTGLLVIDGVTVAKGTDR